MPLGAIGMLILREAMLNGLRSGVAAAAGVAFVDLVYAALAVGVGVLFAPAIRSWGAVPALICGTVLIGLGLRQLAEARKPASSAGEVPSGAVFVRFVGLTAINPLTLLYFFALGGWLTAAADGPAAAVAFVLAAGAASLVWQLSLAFAGRGLGAVIPDSVTRILGVLASGLVIALGLAVLVSAFAGAG